MTAPPHNGKVARGERAVVQGRSDERSIEPDVDELLKLAHRGHAAPGEQFHIRVGMAEVLEQRDVRASPAPDARHIEHEQRRGAGSDRGARQIDGRASRPGRVQGLAVPQVEGEDHPGGANRPGHRRQGLKRRQRFEPHDQPLDPVGEEISGPRRGRHARIDEQAAPQRREVSQPFRLDGPTSEGIEVGHVPFIATEHVAVRTRQGSRVAYGRNEPGADGHIRIPLAATPRNRLPSGEVEHRDYPHRGPPDPPRT